MICFFCGDPSPCIGEDLGADVNAMTADSNAVLGNDHAPGFGRFTFAAE
jgi:hypothetical protein